MNRWSQTLDLSDVFHADMPFEEKRDEMVRRIRALDPNEQDGELQSIADDLAETTDGDEWDQPWDSFYDWADHNRVWISTFGRKAVAR
jgi:hypothetical protein